ncbi:MAG: hypothetical protein JJ979_06085 [Roseibium sp.]|nr:hypothetical protein [Roseibium sp.]
MSGLHTFSIGRAGKLLSLALAGAFVSLAAIQTADAQTRRVDSRSLTCSQVQSMINQRGAVLLSTGQYTFDRYVSNRNQCQHGEVLYRDTVPTKDNGRCRVQRCADDFRFYRD